MKKAFTFAVAIVCAATVAFASEDWRGNNRIQGTVVDKTTGKPVAKATIKLRSQRGSHGGPDATTDASGKFAFLGLGAGLWNMDVEAANYVVRQLGNIPIAEGERVPPMKIELEPEVRQEAATTTAEAPHEEVRVAGQVVTKDIADAIEAGNVALTNKNYKEAISNFQKASAALPTLMPLKFALARAYDGAGDKQNALATMAEVYNADPTSAQNASIYYDMLIGAGVDKMNRKEAAAAVPFFDKAVALNAKSHLGYYYRGLAYIQAGQVKQAKPDLLKVVELAPASDEATEAKEYLKSIK